MSTVFGIITNNSIKSRRKASARKSDERFVDVLKKNNDNAKKTRLAINKVIAEIPIIFVFVDMFIATYNMLFFLKIFLNLFFLEWISPPFVRRSII